MNLSEFLTDDQIAVVCCLGALTVCGLIAAVSYHLGPAGREDRNNRRSTGPVLAQPELQHGEGQRRAA